MPMPDINASPADLQEANLQEAIDRLSNYNDYLVQRTSNLRALYNKAVEVIKDLSEQLDALTVDPDAPAEGGPDVVPGEATEATTPAAPPAPAQPVNDENAAMIAAAEGNPDGVVLDEAAVPEGHSEVPAQPEE